MDFSFSSEQQMAAEVARQMLGERCTPSQLRQLLASGAARDQARWQAVSQMGLPGVLLPESAGGLGLAEPDFVLIAESCGYAALPEPLVEHAGVAAPLLAASGGDALLLAASASGAATLAIAHPVNPFVADADSAAALLLERDGEVHVLRAAEVVLTREPSIDPFRRLFRIDWQPTAATRVVAAAAGRALWADALDRGALFTAAQCLGLAQRCVDLAVAYARERQQFGKPIGSYQAVKHLLANAQVSIEFARPVVHAAAAQFAARDAMSRARISHAKLAAVAAADLGARTAVQVHGAMGFSWAVDVHFFLKRALALTYAWGEPAFHQARVESRVLQYPLGPDQTFNHERPHA
jgi:alkylation response protein AidB-like acyl-CoA dehydrogenase